MTDVARSQRLRRVTNVQSARDDKIFSDGPQIRATQEDRQAWGGFCEIESEPANFNYILDNFGVRGARIHEIYSLDDESLAYLPQPVYGLIFLFKWRQDHESEQEQSCPEDIWFANQTVDNACASVALLNIVNNVPNLDLGPNLQSFKDFTKDFSPALRGDAIANFSFVKEIHNTFARKLDMLNIDLSTKSNATLSKRSKSHRNRDDDSESSFHFIAYMPISDYAWKFDGLERQPHRLGKLASEDWLNLVKPDIESRIAKYEEGQIEFAILGLVHDSMISLAEGLAQNIKDLECLSARLKLGWPGSNGGAMDERNGQTQSNSEVLLGPSKRYGIRQEAIDARGVSDRVKEVIDTATEASVQEAMGQLIADQVRLRRSILEEIETRESESRQVACRQHDFGPLAQRVAEIIAKRDAVDLMRESKKTGAKKRR